MQNTTNETNTPIETYLTIEEILILYDYLKHEFIPYYNEPLQEVMNKILAIVKQHELDSANSQSTC
jgi:hypothetical protein